MGTIKALELLLDVADGDTKIIPGHGVVSNAGEVQAFLDMLLVIRDRVRASIDEDMSLEEAQAAGLTKEYDDRWESSGRIGGSAALISAALISAAYADMAQR